MRPAWAGWAGFALACIASMLVVAGWAAGIDWRSPLVPGHERVYPGSRFRAARGKAEVRDQALAVTAAGEDSSSLQVTSVPGFATRDFTVLRYRFDDFPDTLELTLAFRTEESPDDVVAVPLPRPGGTWATVDLSRLPEWKGTLIEFGFAEFAVSHNVPPRLGFRPFRLMRAELRSASWLDSLAALATEWTTAWPWSQRSVHSLGRDGGGLHMRSPVTAAALLVLLAGFWAAVFLPAWRGRGAGGVLLLAGLAWLVLDLRWQHELAARLELARSVYAGVDWPVRSRRVSDEGILEAADTLRALVGAEVESRRILVQGGTGYETLRLIWHLLPLNAAPLPHALARAHSIPDGSLIVFYDTTEWRDSALMQRLVERSERLGLAGAEDADRAAAEPRLVVFRYHHEP